MALTKEEQAELDGLNQLYEAHQASQAQPETNDRLTGNNPTIASRVMDAVRSARNSPVAEAILGRSGSTPSENVIDTQGLAGKLVDAGLEGGGATGGQALGAFGGPLAPVTVPLLGAAGGGLGNLLAQIRDGNGISPGKVLGAAASGAIPGSGLAKAGLGGLAKEGLKYGLSNLAGKALETGVDQQRMPTGTEAATSVLGGLAGAGMGKLLDKGANAIAQKAALAEAQDATRRETIKLGRDLGYVIPPSVVNPSSTNNALNSIGGKASTAQQAMLNNQKITNNAVRKELGLAESTPLSRDALNLAKVGPNKVYSEVAALSPQADAALANYKQFSSDARSGFAAYRDSRDPSVLEKARQAVADADAMHQLMDSEAKAAGKPDLAKKLNEAKVQLAKIGLAERALNPGDGNIRAKVIGDAYDDGEKVTGAFEKIGKFQTAFGNLLREQSKVPPAGVNQLSTYLAAGAGIMGAGTMGPAGAAAAVLPYAAASPARTLMLSKPYQQAMVNPVYGTTRQDIPAMLARYGTQAASRQIDPSQYLNH